MRHDRWGLDLTAYSAVEAWGFTGGDYRVPAQSELDALAAKIDYTQVKLDRDSGQASLPDGMELDLGAVAKGWAGDILLPSWCGTPTGWTGPC